MKNDPLSLVTNKCYCNFCPSYCCYQLSGSQLLITAEDINRIARKFNITDGEVRSKYIEGKNTFRVKADGSCVFLIDGRIDKRCSIHDARPRQCSDFPYNDPCPYLERVDLLEEIQPKIVASIFACDSTDVSLK